ncbi:MAG: hypothetical protein LBB27_01805 [Tannerellaceae bacterium]|jgi:hypothetical protein|nr:hypothetical protein [Tannerellaceae bacterium]
MTGKYLWALLGLLGSLTGTAKTYHYVATWGDNAAAGTSWAAPLKTFEVALERAQSGDIILLSEGRFLTDTASFVIRTDLTVIGGYAGTESEDDDPTGTKPTELLPSEIFRHRVLRIGTYETPNIKVLLRNLTIMGGDATDDVPVRRGGGIYNYADTELRDVQVVNNIACQGLYLTTADNAEAFGGGIYNDMGRLTLSGKTTVASNTASHVAAATGYGGGIYSDGVLTISDASTVLIAENVASLEAPTGFGGGIYNKRILNIRGGANIRENIASKGSTSGTIPYITEGFGGFGGGIANHGEEAIATIYNAVIYENYATYNINNGFPAHGGGIHNDDGGQLSVLFPSVVRNNVATTGIGVGCGGGISSIRSGSKLMLTATVENNTAISNVHNSSDAFGGGIFCGDAMVSEASFLTSERSAVIYNNVATTGSGKVFEQGVYPDLTHTVTLNPSPYVFMFPVSGSYEIPDGGDFTVLFNINLGSSIGRLGLLVNDSSVWFPEKNASNPITVPYLKNIREDKSYTAAFFASVIVGETEFVKTEIPAGTHDIRMDKPFEFIFTVAEGRRDFVKVDVDGKMYEAEALGGGKYRYILSLTKDVVWIKPTLTPIFTLSFDAPSGVAIFFRGLALNNPAVPLDFAVGDVPSFVIDFQNTVGLKEIYVNGKLCDNLRWLSGTKYDLTLPPITENLSVRVRLVVSGGLSVAAPSPSGEIRLTASAQGLKVETSEAQAISVYALTGQLKVKQTVRGTAFVPLTKGIYIVKAGEQVNRVMVR